MTRLLTFNINGPGTKYGDWSQRRDLVCRLLAEVDADLVALQAVRHAPEQADARDQAAQLADRIPGYPHVSFHPAHRHPDGAVDGLALLSRLPCQPVAVTPLSHRPGTEDPFDRVLACASLDLPSGPLHLVNAHFSWVEGQALDNVEEALRLLDSLPAPRLLVGDLNSQPGSPPMQRFARDGWVDVWSLLRPDCPGLTFESPSPTMRIDYVWADQAAQARLESIQVVGDVADGNRRPSDHLGLLLTLTSR